MSDNISRLFKSSENFEVGFELTNTTIPYTLRKVSKISELSIINTTGYDISVVDNFGVITTHSSMKLTKSFADYLSVHQNASAVFFIHRRPMTSEDLVRTIDNEQKIRTTGDSYNIVHKGLHNVISNKLKEFYIIYSIESKEITKNRTISISELNLTVALKGYEAKNLQMIHTDIETAPVDNRIYNIISYYNTNVDSYVFVNVLGTVIRIDATYGESESVVFTHDEGNIVKEKVIKPEEFKIHNIFRNSKEAEENMDNDAILAKRKLDIEMHNVEAKLISNIVADIANVYKLKVDLLMKKYQSIVDLDKVRIAKDEKDNKTCQMVDSAKKYIDVLSMIKKIILV